MKTSELTGAALDWAVAKCIYEPDDVVICDGRVFAYDDATKGFNPSTDWAQGGPIIERERISVWFERHDDVDSGLPIWFAQDGYAPAMQGQTPLVAAMRCHVAGILGDEVEVPDGLN